MNNYLRKTGTVLGRPWFYSNQEKPQVLIRPQMSSLDQPSKNRLESMGKAVTWDIKVLKTSHLPQSVLLEQLNLITEIQNNEHFSSCSKELAPQLMSMAATGPKSVTNELSVVVIHSNNNTTSARTHQAIWQAVLIPHILWETLIEFYVFLEGWIVRAVKVHLSWRPAVGRQQRIQGKAAWHLTIRTTQTSSLYTLTASGLAENVH
jgi:hypothetical protein